MAAAKNPARGESHYAWKGDLARAETKRERAQKAFALTKCESCDAQATDRHHIDGDTGNNVRANIAILCRRCHMIADGRLDAFKRAQRAAMPPRQCVVCSRDTTRTWKGRCHACNEYFRRNARDRSPERIAAAAARGRPKTMEHVFAMGRSATVAEWSDSLGVPRRAIIKRLESGWDPALAVSASPMSGVDKARLTHRKRGL